MSDPEQLPLIDPDQDREWDRLDSQAQFTDRRNRDASGMTHSSDDIERREKPSVKPSTPVKGRQRGGTFQGVKGIIADNDRTAQTQRELEDSTNALRSQPLSPEEQAFGIEQARRMLEGIETPPEPDK